MRVGDPGTVQFLGYRCTATRAGASRGGEDGEIKAVFPYFYTTCGVGTNVESSKQMGRDIAEDLRKAGVQAAILTST